MTTATQTTYVYAAPLSQHSLWDLMVNAMAKVKAHVQYKRAVAKLADLNDHQLTDIGLTRAEVRGLTRNNRVETSCMRALRHGSADLMSLSYPS